MYPDNYIFKLARSLVLSEGEDIDLLETDPFSLREKYLDCEKQDLAIFWAICLVPNMAGELDEVEKIEIYDNTEDEEEVIDIGDDIVYQGVLKEDTYVETYFYFPDEWVEKLYTLAGQKV